MIRILLSTRLGERRMTQTELARATGIRAQTINELYHDFAERISLDDLDLICEALDCGIIHSSKGDGQTYRASFFAASQVKPLPTA